MAGACGFRERTTEAGVAVVATCAAAEGCGVGVATGGLGGVGVIAFVSAPSPEYSNASCPALILIVIGVLQY